MRVYDLSMPLDSTSGDPLPPKIEYRDHVVGRPHLAKLLGVDLEELPDGLGSATETVTARTHNSTHMDAPYHYFPTTGSRPARRIDEIPLNWCIGPGVVLDFHERPAGYEMTPQDVEDGLGRVSHDLKPGHIVFVRTDAYKRYHSPDYALSHPGMGAAATEWLIDHGVKIMGIDAWSWDIPLPMQGESFRRSGGKDRAQLWAAHRVGKRKEYLHIEQMGHLDALPRPTGFTAIVFPIAVSKGSAGWVRAAAVFGGPLSV